MIKVGFDISQTAHVGGVANYTLELAKELLNQDELEMVYFYSSLRKPFKKGLLKNVKSFRLPPTLFEVLFNKIRNFPIEKFLGAIDIFHSSDWVQPPAKALKVTTYHDLVPILYPDWSRPKIVAVHKRRLQLVEQEIDMVIAVSESTKKDLLKVSSIPESRIQVIYEGVSEEFKKLGESEVNKFRKKYNLPEKFILSIGGIGERRNLKRVRQATDGFKLVITGEMLPWIPKEELPLLYNAAQILLYPSFYEGFGLPILEAMACSLPVITANRSSMKELSEGAALLVNPEDEAGISKAVKDVMEDQKLRTELIEKGLRRVKQFSWEKCARETADLYKRMVREKG